MPQFKILQWDISHIKNSFFHLLYNPHLRRILALFLLLLGLIQLWNNYHQAKTTVVIARSILHPGVPIMPDMIEMRTVPQQQLPATLLTDPHEVESHYVMIPILPGEFISRSQLLDHIQAEQYLPAEVHPRIVPLVIHDPSMVRALKPGQIVDIISKSSDPTLQKHGEILAQNGIIVSIINPDADQRNSESIVYMALSHNDAQKTAESTAEFGFIFH